MISPSARFLASAAGAYAAWFSCHSAPALSELEQPGVQEIVVLLHDVLRLEPLRLLAQSMK